MPKLAPVSETLSLAKEFRTRARVWRELDAFADRWTAHRPRDDGFHVLDHVCAWVCCARRCNRAEIELLATLSPAHGHAARHAGRRADAVGRLLVESARYLGLGKPAAARAPISEAITLLRSPAAKKTLGDARHDLIWLARSCFAEAHRRLNEHGRAEDALRKIELDAVRDPEIRASILEIRAELWRRQGRGPQALVLYDQIVELLDGAAGMPAPTRDRIRLLDQRRAEARLRQGAILLQLGRFDGAAETLRRANDLLHVGPPDRLRHDILHLLAVADVKNGDPDAARRDLEHAAEIARQIPIPARLAAEKRWLTGLLSAQGTRYREASEIMLDATERLIGLERFVDGTRALLELLPLIAVCRDHDLIAAVERLGDRIAVSSEARHYLAARLGVVRERLRAQKLLDPRLRELIGYLAGAARER